MAFKDWWPRWGRILTPVVTLDLRSLALFRILLGGLLLIDILLRFLDLEAFYTDLGVLPRSVAIEYFASLTNFSFHLASGSSWFQGVLLSVAGIAAILLALGYKTRYVVWISWIMILSLHRRNPIILQGGDVLLRIMVLFAAVMPISQVWSLDGAGSNKKNDKPSSYISVITAAYILQIMAVYVTTAILKWKVPAWQSGLGMAYAMRLEQYTTSLGGMIGAWSNDVLIPLNYLVLAVEGLAPFLLLIPWKNGFFRCLCIATFAWFHLAILFTLEVGLFSFISILAWIPLIPSSVWQAFNRRGLVGVYSPMLAEGGKLSFGRWRAAGEALFGLICIAVIITWNIPAVSKFKADAKLPAGVNRAASFAGFDQQWSMFSTPVFADGWIAIPAVRTDGSMTDLFSNNPYTGISKPQSISATFPRDRWRKYWRNLLGDHENQRLRFGQYLCRKSYREDPVAKRIEAFQIIFIKMEIKAQGGHEPPRKVLLWQHECANGHLEKWQGKLPYATLDFPI